MMCSPDTGAIYIRIIMNCVQIQMKDVSDGKAQIPLLIFFSALGNVTDSSREKNTIYFLTIYTHAFSRKVSPVITVQSAAI